MRVLDKVWDTSKELIKFQKLMVRVRVMDSPASDLSATSLEPVCDQDSVTEFGLKKTNVIDEQYQQGLPSTDSDP